MGNPFRGCPFSCFLSCPIGERFGMELDSSCRKMSRKSGQKKDKYGAMLNENRGKNGVKFKKNSQNCPFFSSV